MSTQSGAEQPGWLLEQESKKDRQETYAALDVGRRAFEQVANGETGAGRQAQALGRLADTIDQPTARVVSRALAALRTTLFDDYQDVYTGDSTERRALVQYVPVGTIRELGKYIETVLTRTLDSDPPQADEVTDFLVEWVRNCASRLRSDALFGGGGIWVSSTTESTALSRWGHDLEDIGEELTRSLRAATALERVEEAAEDATKAADAARRAAGISGTARIGDHFVKVAKREGKLASQWTAFTIAAIVAVVGIAGLILKPDTAAPDRPWYEALAHLALVLPIIGLASYTARIARHHRMFARWSDTAAVQIESVEAFALQMERPEAQEELILGLGHSVFTTPTFSDDPKTEHVSAIPTEVVDALKVLAERLRPSS